MSDEWANTMRAVAEGTAEPPAPPLRVPWHSLTTEDGHRIDWQVLPGSHGLRNRRLLVVEIDEAAEARVPEAMAVLADPVKPSVPSAL